MEKKICSKCKLEKDVCEFIPDKSRKDGFNGKCRICKSLYDKKRYLNNLDSFKKRSKDYYENNKETSIKSSKIWAKNNPKKRKRIVNNWVKNNPNKIKVSRQKYESKNKTKIKIKRKVYNSKNRDKQRLYEKQKRKTDVLFKLKNNMRTRLNMYLKSKNITKKNKTFNYTGCTPQFLKEYIEKQFTEGMSWDKMGQYIHIDHIIPLSSAKTEEDVYKLCHYTNLQPLWAEDNLKKSNKIMYL